ncbi:hypothetical protein HF521_010969 [Silurus meridionalis]|uniref:SCP domain-containing protein n=1 Tax=Silurus meridionalis TaxID=175797 RepID=A0A8T0AHR9_SILME|nr:hypothetical protein HF521_010969 [Silurus meridionalis]
MAKRYAAPEALDFIFNHESDQEARSQIDNQICTTLQAVQDEIVNIHNMFRRQVDPPASNMLMMSWSSEVAAIAQKWADTCSMEHGPPSSRMLGSYEMGENLLEGSPVISWTDVITEWHSEVANYNYSSGSGNGKPIGHYTQVVWFGSYQVGCGVAKCGGAYFYDCHQSMHLCQHYSNCKELKENAPCYPDLKLYCEAECFCTTEIVPTN